MSTNANSGLKCGPKGRTSQLNVVKEDKSKSQSHLSNLVFTNCLVSMNSRLEKLIYSFEKFFDFKIVFNGKLVGHRISLA